MWIGFSKPKSVPTKSFHPPLRRGYLKPKSAPTKTFHPLNYSNTLQVLKVWSVLRIWINFPTRKVFKSNLGEFSRKVWPYLIIWRKDYYFLRCVWKLLLLGHRCCSSSCLKQVYFCYFRKKQSVTDLFIFLYFTYFRCTTISYTLFLSIIMYWTPQGSLFCTNMGWKQSNHAIKWPFCLLSRINNWSNHLFLINLSLFLTKHFKVQSN